LTISGELGQLCDEGEPEPLGQGVGLEDAPGLPLAAGAALPDAEVVAVGVADGLAEPPGIGRPPMIDSIGFGEADGVALEHGSAAPADPLLDITNAGATSTPPASAAPRTAAAARERRIEVIGHLSSCPVRRVRNVPAQPGRGAQPFPGRAESPE
jgi:hypothetical protein